MNVQFVFFQRSLYLSTLITMKRNLIYLIAALLLPLLSIAQSNDPYVTKGLELYNNKDYNGALEYFTKEVELNPNNIEAYNYEGIIKIQQGDFKAAAEIFTKEISINQGNDIAYSNRAYAKIGLNDFNGAIVDCDHALVLN